MNQDIDFYKENGYVIKKILTSEQCNEINNYINNNNKNAYYEKNTNEKFGYKFDKDEISPVINYINNNSFIHNFAKNILKDYDYSVIKSFYKSAFMARDIEYHQESQYEDHHPTRGNWEDYIQIFVALEDHSLENACLKIIPKSHKLGLLPYTDIVNSNLEHKRSVEYKSLKNAYNKYGILNCTLKQGEAIFFNHLIIHGSQNNNGPFSRHALVCTLYKSGLKLNDEKYKQFEKERKNFTINVLEDKIKELKLQIDKL
jgi:ectoine hydroxylase-related dioxygenase (phytanoyl-CoA dioxygenase family)